MRDNEQFSVLLFFAIVGLIASIIFSSVIISNTSAIKKNLQNQ